MAWLGSGSALWLTVLCGDKRGGEKGTRNKGGRDGVSSERNRVKRWGERVKGKERIACVRAYVVERGGDLGACVLRGAKWGVGEGLGGTENS